ncbi:hypothetical protein FXF65_17515 [Actinomadura syzygii]|uniref:Uncharacterized protein n=1 Tax=Actinomadura syzygii TaxID=1427538 RepID=A0A5D0U9Q6_9ACTN|nr:hypothetical protein FXF65_17515 [Actinomadura syzygii]
MAFPDASTAIYEDPRLRECDYGDLNGSPVSVVAAERAHRIAPPRPGRPELPPGDPSHQRLPL